MAHVVRLSLILFLSVFCVVNMLRIHSALPWSFFDQTLHIKGNFCGKVYFSILSLNIGYSKFSVKLNRPRDDDNCKCNKCNM